MLMRQHTATNEVAVFETICVKTHICICDTMVHWFVHMQISDVIFVHEKSLNLHCNVN